MEFRETLGRADSLVERVTSKLASIDSLSPESL